MKEGSGSLATASGSKRKASEVFNSEAADTRTGGPLGSSITQEDKWSVLPEGALEIKNGDEDIYKKVPDKSAFRSVRYADDNAGYFGMRSIDGRPEQPFPAVYETDFSKEKMLQYRKAMLDIMSKTFGEKVKVTATLGDLDEGIDWLRRQEKLMDMRKADAFIHTLYNWKQPGGLELLKRLAPEYYERRVKALDLDQKIKSRDAILEFTGLQTSDDIAYYLRRKTGDIMTFDEVQTKTNIKQAEASKNFAYGRWRALFRPKQHTEALDLIGGLKFDPKSAFGPNPFLPGDVTSGEDKYSRMSSSGVAGIWPFSVLARPDEGGGD